MNGRKVLVLDGRSLSCLAFVRSLGSAGAEVHVGESFRHNISAYSCYTQENHVHPSADEDTTAFRDWLLKLVEQERYDFVVPTRDATTIALAALQDDFAAPTSTLLSTPENVAVLNDKGRCAELAEDVGVPIPTTYHPTGTPIKEIADAADFPVLVKPTSASGARGIVRVEDPGELAAAYESVTVNSGPAIVQEFVDHSGGHFSVGTVFDRNSEPRAVHVYEELVQYPDSGGPAVEAISVEVEPWVDDLLDILRAIDWVGPAHMDVLLDPEDGTYRLLEVNPRIWMSIGLTVRSGVNVPRITWDIANGGNPEPVTTYRTGLRYRWVLPSQVLWAGSGDRKLERTKWLLRPRDEPTCYGVLSKCDPQATLGVLTQSLSFVLDAEKRQAVLDRGL